MNDTDVERTSVLGFKVTKCFDLQRFVFLIVVKLTEEIMFNWREKIVDVWYLGTNQNGIIFELYDSANTPKRVFTMCRTILLQVTSRPFMKNLFVELLN